MDQIFGDGNHKIDFEIHVILHNAAVSHSCNDTVAFQDRYALDICIRLR